MSPEELKAASEELLGGKEPVRAAGVFGLKDDYLALFGAAAVTEAAAPGGDTAAEAAKTAIATEAGRQANAARQGVTVRMVVAVTASAIHVFAMDALGSRATRELLSFPRPGTEVEVSRFGLSRRVTLHDRSADRRLELTGSTAPWSSTAKGDKAVLAELAG